MFRVLCLSGGGFKGLFSSRVLEHVERHTGRLIADSFELIAGTSVGAIIALAAAARVDMKTLTTRLQELGPRVFSGHEHSVGLIGKAQRFIENSRKPKYDASKLRSSLIDIFGEKKIGDLTAAVVIPATNLTAGRPKVFKTPHHTRFFRDQHYSLVDVAMASAAAPTYFSLACVENEMFADGGLFATAPDLVATHEAETWLDIAREEMRILSVGTVSTRFSLPHNLGLEFGIINWMVNQRLLEAMFSSQQQLSQSMLQQRYGSHYVRIDATPSKEISQSIGLDIADRATQSTLLGLADDQAGSALNDPNLLEMLSAPARPVPMYHG